MTGHRGDDRVFPSGCVEGESVLLVRLAQVLTEPLQSRIMNASGPGSNVSR